MPKTRIIAMCSPVTLERDTASGPSLSHFKVFKMLSKQLLGAGEGCYFPWRWGNKSVSEHLGPSQPPGLLGY